MEKNPYYAGGGGGSSPNVPQENFLYYYHPDHLGSSSYVTDSIGKVFEHLQYFPFGETWVEESSNTQRTPYLFTAKELDEETGLYYFGARYYDPRVSVWQNSDPILGEYLAGAVNDGVYNPININLYRYAAQNPLRLIDPTGNSEEESSCDESCQIRNEIQATRRPQEERAKAVAEGVSKAGDVIETGYGLTAGGGVGAATKVVTGGMKGILRGIKSLFSRQGTELKSAVKPDALQSILQVKNARGNFNIGSMARSEMDELGAAWVGPNARAMMKGDEQIGWVSADGLKTYRFPQLKENGMAAGRTQGNLTEFLRLDNGKTEILRNAHIDLVP